MTIPYKPLSEQAQALINQFESDVWDIGYANLDLSDAPPDASCDPLIAYVQALEALRDVMQAYYADWRAAYTSGRYDEAIEIAQEAFQRLEADKTFETGEGDG